MWILHPENENEESFSILCGRSFTIGRLKFDYGLTVESDNTISRKHAFIEVNATKNLTNIRNIPQMKIIDISKFGTFVNSKRVVGFTVIKSGDNVRFGNKSCKFRITFEPLICTSSLLASKARVNERLLTLGGYHVSEWSPACNFVVMSKIVVTIKLLLAVLTQKYVVTDDYLQDLISASVAKKSPPTNLIDYLPNESETINDRRSIDFTPNINRMCLFTGKTFVFTTLKTFEYLRSCVEMAGGKCVLLDSANSKLLKHRDTVIMDVPLDTQRVAYEDPRADELAAIVKKKNHRRIPEHEIGFAILFVDTTEFTNPENGVAECTSEIEEDLAETCDLDLINDDDDGNFCVKSEEKIQKSWENNKNSSISLISDEEDSDTSCVKIIELQSYNTAMDPVTIVDSPSPQPPSPASLESAKPKQSRTLRPPPRTSKRKKKTAEPPPAKKRNTSSEDRNVSHENNSFANSADEDFVGDKTPVKKKTTPKRAAPKRKQLKKAGKDTDWLLDADSINQDTSVKTSEKTTSKKSNIRGSSGDFCIPETVKSEKQDDSTFIDGIKETVPDVIFNVEQEITTERTSIQKSEEFVDNDSTNLNKIKSTPKRAAPKRKQLKKPGNDNDWLMDDSTVQKSPATTSTKTSDNMTSGKVVEPSKVATLQSSRKITKKRFFDDSQNEESNDDRSSNVASNKSSASKKSKRMGSWGDSSEPDTEIKTENQDEDQDNSDQELIQHSSTSSSHTKLIQDAVAIEKKENICAENLVEGFLTSRSTLKCEKRENEYEKEANIPSNLMVVRVVNLQVSKKENKNKNSSSSIADVQQSKPGDKVFWKGRYLRNFKNFQKSNAFQGIPEIIGRNDLIVNQSQVLVSDETINEMLNTQTTIDDYRDFDDEFSTKNAPKKLPSRRKR